MSIEEVPWITLLSLSVLIYATTKAIKTTYKQKFFYLYITNYKYIGSRYFYTSRNPERDYKEVFFEEEPQIINDNDPLSYVRVNGQRTLEVDWFNNYEKISSRIEREIFNKSFIDQRVEEEIKPVFLMLFEFKV